MNLTALSDVLGARQLQEGVFQPGVASEADMPVRQECHSRGEEFFPGDGLMFTTNCSRPCSPRRVTWQIAGAMLVLLLGLVPLASGQELARVDVPALANANELLNPFDDPSSSSQVTESLLQVSLPVSVWLDPRTREAFYAVEFEVTWAKSLYPLADYWPKSILQSPYDGVVMTERQAERRLNGGLSTDGLLQTFATAANVAGSMEEKVSRRYAEIPEQEPLIESGTAGRGTGAFFRFHDSRQVAIEGGRELRLLYRLPESWRAGLFLVRARIYLRSGLGEEPRLHYQREFTVPVHRANDPVARQQAIAYVQAESRLRSLWTAQTSVRGSSKIGAVWNRRSRVDSTLDLEKILSDSSGSELMAAGKRLSGEFQEAAANLLACRAELLDLSR